MERIVIAFGGNALLRKGDDQTFETQADRAEQAFQKLAKVIEDNEVVISHGNGPQVGSILLQNESAVRTVKPMPLHACGAMSQGLIGEMLSNGWDRVRFRLGISKEPSVLMTRSVVDPDDPAFSNPTKPIGPYYSSDESARLQRLKGWKMREEPGKGFRRLVPSPIPVDIVERNQIVSLLREGFLPVASGGGGIPVIKTPAGYTGVDAVIDKDLASSLLASIVEATTFIILTDVEGAKRNFGMENEELIGKVTAERLQRDLDQGQFASGSMGPKVRAALEFVKRGGKRAIIGSLDNATKVAEGKSGTIIEAGSL